MELPSQTQSTILHQSPSNLAVSEELRGFMLAWNFSNLHAMLSEYSAAELLSCEGFSYHCLTELYGFLEENGCEGMLRE